MLQTLNVLLARRPPKGRRLLIIATTAQRPVLTDLGLSEVFDSELRVTPIATLRALDTALREVELFRQDAPMRYPCGRAALCEAVARVRCAPWRLVGRDSVRAARACVLGKGCATGIRQRAAGNGHRAAGDGHRVVGDGHRAARGM